MKFWDASAIVPLLVAEESTRQLQTLAAEDLRYARVVGVHSRMHFRFGAPRT